MRAQSKVTATATGRTSGKALFTSAVRSSAPLAASSAAAHRRLFYPALHRLSLGLSSSLAIPILALPHKQVLAEMSTSSVDTSSFYNLKANLANHSEFDFATLKGKVVLIVNVASKCKFTPQYSGLEELYKKFKDQGLVILGFPCNQFAKQEPGKEEEIVSFCTLNYGVSFPVMEKVDVNGKEEHPVYQHLKSQKKQLGMKAIKWNFEKFLVGKNGDVVQRFSSLTKPEDIEQYITAELAK